MGTAAKVDGSDTTVTQIHSCNEWVGRVDQGNTKDKLLIAALFSSIYLARGKGDLSLKDLYNSKDLLNRD